MERAKVTTKGQVTIPFKVRESLGIRPGDELEFRESPEGYVITRKVLTSPFDRYVGYLKDKAGQDPDALVREMRGE